MSCQIIIHGGAHDLVSENDKRNTICQHIIDSLKDDLCHGADALDICEKAINALENEPLFDAGTGSFIQVDGMIRMDASLMTSDNQLGAVLQISNIKNPISVARKLLEDPMHVVLSGAGADQFAKEMGFNNYDPAIGKQKDTLQKVLKKLNGDLSYRNISQHFSSSFNDSLGTVGAVVRDNNGKIAAGTSTGGRKVCYPGRVGDSGIAGNGTFANQYAGISCTGIGEKILIIGAARLIASYVECGKSIVTACDDTIKQLKLIGGLGGFIAISQKGNMCAVHNTACLTHASFSS